MRTPLAAFAALLVLAGGSFVQTAAALPPSCSANDPPAVCIDRSDLPPLPPLPHVRRQFHDDHTCTVYVDVDDDGHRDAGEPGARNALFCRVDAKVFVLLGQGY